MLFNLSNLNSNLGLTLGYLNPALNNSALMAKIVNCWHVAPCKGIQHSLGFYIPCLGFPIPGTGFKTLSGELGFWIPVLVGFQIRWALFRIPKAKFQIQDSKILIFLHGTRHETETLEGQQLGGKTTEAMFTLMTAFRVSTKSYPVRLSRMVWTATTHVYTRCIQYPVGRPFTTIKKNAWRSSLFQCIGQDLKQSPAIIEVTAKSDFNTFKTLLQTHYFREAFNLYFLFSVSYSIHLRILL